MCGILNKKVQSETNVINILEHLKPTFFFYRILNPHFFYFISWDILNPHFPLIVISAIDLKLG